MGGPPLPPPAPSLRTGRGTGAREHGGGGDGGGAHAREALIAIGARRRRQVCAYAVLDVLSNAVVGFIVTGAHNALAQGITKEFI